jgi:Fur family ferric uptake transcriptional regulator
MILKESLMDVQGRVVYERFDEGHHDHIVCLDCGQILEFHDDEIEAQQQKVTKKLRFEEVRHRHVIYARCSYLKKT